MKKSVVTVTVIVDSPPSQTALRETVLVCLAGTIKAIEDDGLHSAAEVNHRFQDRSNLKNVGTVELGVDELTTYLPAR